MKRTLSIGIVIAFLIFGFVLSNAATVYENPVSKYGWSKVQYSYEGTSSDEKINSYFMYNDGLFLQDATVLNGEMAKMCVALAASAYDRETITQVLGWSYWKEDDEYRPVSRGLKFDELLSHKESYNRKLTYDDNDYVAYTIARKVIGDYTVYCVPIRGTAANAEWFSDFNLGEGRDHEGFHKAAKVIYDDLMRFVSNDDVSEDKTILLFTGHSRGAAVANILTYQFTRRTSIPDKQIFGYTFACPSVSMDTDKTLKNLFNFNNPGDLIPLLPLEDWKDAKYSRHGQTLEVYSASSLPIKENVYKQFARISGARCLSEDNPKKYLDLIHTYVKSKKQYNTAVYQCVFKLIAQGLGGHNDVSWWKFIWENKFTLAYIIGISVAELEAEAEKLSDPYSMLSRGSDLDVKYLELIRFIENNEEELLGMSSERYSQFYQENKDTIDEIRIYTGLEMTSASLLLDSKTTLNEMVIRQREEFPLLFGIVKLFYDFDAHPAESVFHAHTPFFYVMLINSLYFGYEGWREYNGNSNLVLDLKTNSSGVFTIGSNCFYKCDKLETVVLPDEFGSLCSYCFGSCANLTSLTLPKKMRQIEWAAFRDCSSIQGVIVLPDGISFIDEDTFRNCSSLEGIVIPGNIQRINSFAFNNCSGLKEITIPIHTVISEVSNGKYSYVFDGCDQVNHVILTGSGEMSDYVDSTGNGLPSTTPWYLSKSDSLVVDISEGITHIGNFAFASSSVTQVNFPESLVSIGHDAFSGSRIKSLSLPHYINIAYGAFSNCKELSGEVIIPEGTKTIGSSMFFNCISLEKIILPESLTNIDAYAFQNCTGLKHVTISCKTKIYSYGSYNKDAFYGCKNIESVNIIGSGKTLDYSLEDSYGYLLQDYMYTPWYISDADELIITLDPRITEIGEYYFCGCENIKTIPLTNSITTIGNHSFGGCSGLADVSIPDTVTTVGDYAFSGCSNLKEINIPSSVTYLGVCAFQYCNNLQKVAIPSSITSIKVGTFNKCSNLTQVDLPTTITSIGDSAFADCSKLASVIIPDSVTNIGYSAFENCTGLEHISISCNTKISPKNGYKNDSFIGCKSISSVYITGSGEMPDYSEAEIYNYTPWHVSESGALSITIDPRITSIGNYAFSGSKSISEFVIPNSITSIGDRAFGGCSFLNNIEIPNSVVSIGEYAFSSCSSLESVVIPNSVKTIGSGAFYYCNKLKTVSLPKGITSIGNSLFSNCVKLTNINIPDSVSSIGGMAFYSCSSIEKVILPYSVTSLGSSAFAYCSKLNSVVMNREAYASNAFTNSPNVVVHYYYDVSYSHGEHGSVSGKERTFGTDELVLTVKPESGYCVDKVTWDNSSRTIELKPDENGKYVMPDSNSPVAINVTFKKYFSVSVNETVGGFVSVNKSMAAEGEEIIVSVSPSAGYELNEITVNGTAIDGLTFIMGADDATVSASFKKIEYAISVDKSEHGIAITDKSNAFIDDVITVTVIPDEGYELDDIKVNGTTIDGLTFKMGAENVMIVVTFKKVDYSVNVSVVGSGKAFTDKEKANLGDVITLTISPDPCNELESIRISDGEINGNTIVMPAQNITIEVIFKAKAHQLTLVAEKSATCEEDGYEAHYKCTECNKLFSDAEGKNEISAPKVIKKLGHSWDEGTVTKDPICEEDGVKTFHCTHDGCTATKTEPIKALDHSWDEGAVTKEPTCEEAGVKTFHCTRTGCSETKTEPINALGHNVVEVAEKAPTKTDPGNIKHYKCERCGKLFSDSKGKNEITKEQTVIPAMGHDLTAVKAKAATCTESGNTAYYICKDDDCKCGKAYSDPYGQHEINIEDTVKPALGHNPEEVAGKDPTCTEDGYEKYYKCSRCHKLFSDAEGKNEIENPVAISKLGHDMNYVEAKKPTHDDDGHREYYHCDRCGKNFADEYGKTALTDAELVVPHIGAAVLGEEITEGDFIYKVTNPSTDGTGTVTVIGVANKTAAVIIPATVELKLDTYKVNRIGTKAFYGNKTITSLSIGSNVVVIDSYAFYGCSNLVKVSGGKVLKTIGTKAFAYCSKLKSFSISSSVLNKIGSYAFQKDKKLKTVYIKYTTKLTKSGVKKSLKKSYVKTVKVKKSKVKKYKKYFKKSNSGRTVKVKK